MHEQARTQRFAELVAALAEAAADRPDVTLRGSAAPPPAGFAVRLQPHPLSSGTELLLWPEGARISRWAPDGRSDGRPARELNLRLETGFRWEYLVFPDAATLAVALLQRLENELARQNAPVRRRRRPVVTAAQKGSGRR
jgi:hypothetical protein